MIHRLTRIAMFLFFLIAAEVAYTVLAAGTVATRPAAAERPAFNSSPLAGGPAQAATGFYHVATVQGTAWLVDPKGQPTLSIGTDHVRWDGHFCQALGYAPYGRNVARRYGTAAAWAAEAAQRLKLWNFNVLGAGCSKEVRYRGLSHTEFLAFGSDFSSTAALVPKTHWTGWPDVFDPRFEAFCERRAAERCRAGRDDPWLLGYFLDNELEWMGKKWEPLGIAVEAGKLPPTSAGKKALVARLRNTLHDAADFNAEFGTKIASLDDLAALEEELRPKTARGQEALAAFIADAAGRYFRITTSAVRRYDSKHMILGCRFAHDAPEAAWREAGAACEVVSVNVYPRIDLWRQKTVGLEEHLRKRYATCGKPLLLTEWGFPALDAKDSANRPLPSLHGAGMRVDTQEQKAACYAIFQRDLFSLPFVVGSHYFMWCDEPALGISESFPEDSNYGLVNESDDPYALLTATAARVNARLADLHAGRIARGDIAAGYQPPPIQGNPVASPRRAPRDLHFARTATGFTIDNGPLKLVKDQPGGKFLDRVLLRDGEKTDAIELGCYEAVLQLKTVEGSRWVHADRLTSVRVVQQEPARLVLELEAAADGHEAWKAVYRLEVEAGQPAFRARGIAIENSGRRSWQLAGYYHYLPSRIGGNAGHDEPSPRVPNYWISVASWCNPVLRLRYGVLPAQNDTRIEAMFWKDEHQGQHPDCRRVVGRELQPGQRWTADADEPSVLIFGLAEPAGGPPPWASLLGQ